MLLGLAFLALVGPWVKPISAQPASRMALIGAMVDDGTIRLDDYRAVLGVDYVEHEGHVYSDKAPGQPLLAVPFYAAARAVGADPASDRRVDDNLTLWWVTLWTSAIPAAVLVALTYALVARTRPTRAVVATAAIALGSLILPFSAEQYGHLSSAALVLGAWMLLRDGPPSRRALVLAGLCIGTATLIEYQMVLAGAALAAVAVLRGRQRVGWFALGALPALAVLLVYQWAAFGSPFSTSYSHNVGSGNAADAGVPDPGQSLAVLFGARGMFLYAPITAFGLVGLVLIVRQRAHPARPDAAIGLVVFALYWALQGGWANPWGGDMPGPRYLIVALPFLAVGVAWLWDRAALLATTLTAASVAVMVLPLITLHLIPRQGEMVRALARNVDHIGVSPSVWTMAIGSAGWLLHAATVGGLVLLALRPGSAPALEADGPAADAPAMSPAPGVP